MKIAVPPSWTSSPVGLGDLVKRVTDALGIPQCGGCRRRQQMMNRWLVFDPGAWPGQESGGRQDSRAKSVWEV